MSKTTTMFHSRWVCCSCHFQNQSAVKTRSSLTWVYHHDTGTRCCGCTCLPQYATFKPPVVAVENSAVAVSTTSTNVYIICTNGHAIIDMQNFSVNPVALHSPALLIDQSGITWTRPASRMMTRTSVAVLTVAFITIQIGSRCSCAFHSAA